MAGTPPDIPSMRIDILTLFPEMFSGFLDGSLLGAARSAGLVDIRVTNIRDFADGVHRQVDDRPFGGGPGMLLMPGPVVACAEHVLSDGEPASTGVFLLTPGGRRLTQAVVEELAGRSRITLVCGRYEGFDARVGAALAAEELSVGDFVLSGGEVAAMVVVDAVSRLIPGVLGDEESARQDSFSNPGRLVEGPQYTRPREFRGMSVPDVLLSGDHRRIAAWRHEQAVNATRRRMNGTPGAEAPAQGAAIDPRSPLPPAASEPPARAARTPHENLSPRSLP